MSLPAQVFVCILQRTALPPSSGGPAAAAAAAAALATSGEPDNELDPGAPVPVSAPSSTSSTSPTNATPRHLVMPDPFDLACALYDQADFPTAIKHFEVAIAQICPTWTRHHARAARTTSTSHDPSGNRNSSNSSRSGRSANQRSRHERSHTSFIGVSNGNYSQPRAHGAAAAAAAAASMSGSDRACSREGGFGFPQQYPPLPLPSHSSHHASVYELVASAAPSTSASVCVSVAGSTAGSPTSAAAHCAFPHHAVHLPFARTGGGGDGGMHAAVHRPPALSTCSPTHREQHFMPGISSVCVVAPPSAVHSASPPLSALHMTRISSSPDFVQFSATGTASVSAAPSQLALAAPTASSSASGSAHLLSISQQRTSGATLGHRASDNAGSGSGSGNGSSSSSNSARHLSAHHPHARHARSRSADRDLSSFAASAMHADAAPDRVDGEQETGYHDSSSTSAAAHDPHPHHHSKSRGAIEPHSALLPPTQRPGLQRARSTQAPASAGGPFTRAEPLHRAFVVAPGLNEEDEEKGEGEDDRGRHAAASVAAFGHSMPITTSAVPPPPLASSLSADDRERLAMCHNGIACCLMQMTNYRPAKHHLYEALELMPTHHVFFFNLGTLHLERQEFDLAVTCFKKAVRQSSTVPAYHSNLGLAYKSQRDFNRALVALKSAVTLDRSNPSCLYNLACGCLAKLKFKEAVHYLRRAVEQDYNVSYKIGAVSRNSFAIYYTQLAYALLQMHQSSNAIYYASLAISIDCTLPHAHCHRALAFAAMHTYCVAVCDAQQAVRAFHAGVWPSREDVAMIDELRLAMLSWQGLLSNKSEQRDALALMNELSGLAVEASSVPTTVYEQVVTEQQRLKQENAALQIEVERLRNAHAGVTRG